MGVASNFGKLSRWGVKMNVLTRIKNCIKPEEWSFKYVPSLSDTNLKYSLENCVADLIVKKLIIEPYNCIPILYNNQDKLPYCEPF